MRGWEQPPSSIDEMRRRILQLSRDRSFVESTSAMPVAGAYLVRSVLNAADHSGLSGEDRYAMMAYHALEALGRTQDQLLAFVSCTPSPQLLRQSAEHMAERQGG